MPIIVTLDVMLAKRKMSLSELSEAIGLSLTNLSLLKTGHARGVRFNSLDKICEVLECQPGELLSHITHEKYEQLMGEKWDDKWA